MKSKYNISDSEREVLEMLWNYPEGIKQSDLLERFINEGKEWKRQTLNTYLARMEEKGLVHRDKRIVRAVYAEQEYNNLQMKEAIDNMYEGKISKFVMAFMSDKRISKDDAKELKSLLEKYQKDS